MSQIVAINMQDHEASLNLLGLWVLSLGAQQRLAPEEEPTPERLAEEFHRDLGELLAQYAANKMRQAQDVIYLPAVDEVQ